MNLDTIYPDSAFSNAVVPVGARLVFLGYKNGVSGTTSLRYKDSTGQFGNIISASDVQIADAGGYFNGTDVEAALQELGGALGGIETILEGI